MWDDFTPRTWQWFLPAMLIAPCLVIWQKLSATDWGMVPLACAGLLVIAALVNLYLYVMSYQADIYSQVQNARNSTPEVRMMEAGKLMHPETAKILLVHRRTIWRIKYVAQRDLVDWILDEAPNVHAGFVDFVLANSSQGGLMAKRHLSEGSTRFDPEGVVTDYQQYDDLLLLMQQKLMLTQAYGNQAPKFLPPWTVELIRKRFGLVAEEYDSDEMSDAMRRLVENQRQEAEAGPRSNGNGSAVSSQQSTVNSPTRGESQRLNGEQVMLAKSLEQLDQTSSMKAKTDRLLSN